MAPHIEFAAPVLRAQHSLITRRQARRCNLSEGGIDHLLARGIWEPVDRGFAVPG